MLHEMNITLIDGLPLAIAPLRTIILSPRKARSKTSLHVKNEAGYRAMAHACCEFQ